MQLDHACRASLDVTVGQSLFSSQSVSQSVPRLQAHTDRYSIRQSRPVLVAASAGQSNQQFALLRAYGAADKGTPALLERLGRGFEPGVVQAINVLRDASSHAAQALQLGYRCVRCIWPSASKHPGPKQLLSGATVGEVYVGCERRCHLPELLWLPDEHVVLTVDKWIIAAPQPARRAKIGDGRGRLHAAASSSEDSHFAPRCEHARELFNGFIGVLIAGQRQFWR